MIHGFPDPGLVDRPIGGVARNAGRSAALRAEPRNRVSVLRTAAANAGTASVLLLFLFILPALFGGL